MKLSKRQLKRIIREEYSKLKRQALIHESGRSTNRRGQRAASRLEYELAYALDASWFDLSSMKLTDDGGGIIFFGPIHASDGPEGSGRDLGEWYISHDINTKKFWANNDLSREEVHGEDVDDIAEAILMSTERDAYRR